jgi:cytochrome c5
MLLISSTPIRQRAIHGAAAIALFLPGQALAQVDERSGEEVVELLCIKCHGNGLEGAPLAGDRDAWIPRLNRGLDEAVRSAIRGHGKMPARGGLADLTDAEIRSAVVHMIGSATPQYLGAAPARSALPDPYRRSIDGVEVHVGIVPAEALRAQRVSDAHDSAMHRGVPGGRGYYHLNVSLHESHSGAEIRGAAVRATIGNPLGAATRQLEPMRINGTLSYGHYFRIPGSEPYTVSLHIRTPETARPIDAKFEFRR